MKFFANALMVLLLTSSAFVRAEPLTVAVAANLSYVFDDLAGEFRKETGLETRKVLNSSGKISAQIRNGAPFDVFMSADMEFPEGLYQDGYAVASPKVYAYGLLVLWSMKDLDLTKGVAIMAEPSVSKVAVANPKVAPYGRQALKALEYFQLRAAVEPKLVFGESITQVSQYIDSRAADIGFSAKSIVVAPEVAGKGRWVEVPAQSYQPIAQGVVILRHGAEANGDAARKFLAFVLSAKAQKIFLKNGYKLP